MIANKFQQTIEEISMPKTANDLWSEIYKNDYPKAILTFRSGSACTIRLLGTFVSGYRIYVSPNLKLSKKVSNTEFVKILNGNDAVFRSVKQRILNSAPDNVRKKLHVEDTKDIKNSTIKGKEVIETINMLSILSAKTGWQNIVYSNAMVLDSNITHPMSNPSIICLNKDFCYQIMSAVVSGSSSKEDAMRKKVSGLNAFDINISRRGNGLTSKYSINLSKKEKALPRSLVSFVLKEGLWDVGKVVKETNKRNILSKKSGFIYRVAKDYKMSKALMGEIFDQAQELDDTDYINEIEDSITDLPLEAFEDNLGENTIESLDL